MKTSKNIDKKQSPAQGFLFPTVQAFSLARTPVSVPKDAQGLVTLVLVAFKRQAQAMVDSWLTPYLDMFFGKPGFTFYEIPMIKGPVWRLFSTSINAGMRQGIPVKKHKHIITYYGNCDHYISTLDLHDLSLAYAFLLDTKGYIVWRGQGFATPEKIRELLTRATQLSPSNPS